MIALSVMAMAILLVASTILVVRAMSSFASAIAQSPYKSPALSVREAGRSQRELQAWRANQAERLEKLIDRHSADERAGHEAWRKRIAEYDAMSPDEQNRVDPYDTGMAEFIGGPLNGQIHAMREALPTFYWAQALNLDPLMVQEADPSALPEIDEYTYERQFFFSSTGNAVYLCRD